MSTILQRIFIDKLGANARMKEYFTRDVVSIEWFAKLAPSTLNIADGLDVHEIAVFVVPLKTKECPDDIFVFIEKMMPRHLLETPRKFDPRRAKRRWPLWANFPCPLWQNRISP